ncbi:MAG: GldG family protein [Candidatus Rokubacteria bacterium]|nr:GldG family protein [Candidatus Rokubacteria bacterium]
MRRWLDWAGYVGLAALAALAILQWTRASVMTGPHGRWIWWTLLVGGLVLVLAGSVGYLGQAREVMRRRTARYGLNTAVMVVLLLAIVGLVEAVSYRHNARLDLTENKRHSLSPQTIQLLQNLKTEVSAVAFFRSDQPGKRVAEDLLKQYARYGGGKFTWRVVDPDREPGLARRYGVESYGTVVLETKTRSEKVLDAEEEKITNGLVKLTREGKRVVYVVQGHGERELTSSERAGFSEAKAAMERANYEVKPLVLAREGKVPTDASVVIIPGPRTELFPPELDALHGYLGRGGKLLLMADPTAVQGGQDAGLKKLVAAYGVELGDNLVIEVNPIGRLFGIGPEVPIVQEYHSHPITRDLAGISTLFPLTRSVTPAKTPPSGVSVQPLARTSPDSWGETDRASLQAGQVKPDPADPRGPLAVAVVATKDKARLVVYGTSNLAANQFLNLQGNRDFFLNTVSWLAEEEDLISIRPKEARQAPVFLTSLQAQAVFLIPVVVLPGLVLLGGVVTLVRRRASQ